MNVREFKLFVLLLGFLAGNLFGTLLSYLRGFLVWDGLIIATLIIFNEIISYIAYKPLGFALQKVRTGPLKNEDLSVYKFERLQTLVQYTAKSKKIFFLKDKVSQNQEKHAPVKAFFNFFKIGVLIGFFIDAFKVGS